MRKVAVIAALVTMVVTALTISPAASAAPATGMTPTSAAALATGQQPVGSAQITYAVKQFVTRNGRLFARGQVIATVETADGTRTATKNFQARVIKASAKSQRTMLSAKRICDILNLTLAPLRLELLGLIIELDRVVLTIKADSNGGLLGSLLCGLAGPPIGTPKVAAALTKKAQTSGLAGGKVVTPAQALNAQALPPVPGGVCTVLDLVLGPLHLELLGLIVDLSRVHLRITADPTGGLLGQLLCPGIAGQPAAASG